MAACVCEKCGCPVDCGETLCPRCEEGIITHDCSDDEHCDCDEVIEEVRPHLFKLRRRDGVYYLKWIPQ